MNYGTIKVDQITFTNAGVDQTLSVSGIVQSISGGMTVTGTVQGETVIGTSTVSGATVTGNTGEFTSITAATGVFTSYISGLTITGDSAQFITVTGGSAGFTTITGATVTGTTANFATLSGQTITGGHVTTASGTYTGNVTAAAFVPTGSSIPTNGVYLPAANSVALSTNSTERLRIDSTGQIEAVSLGTAAAPTFSWTGDPNTGIYSPGADQVAISTNGTGRLFIDSSGRLLVGSASAYFTPLSGATAPSAQIHSANPIAAQLMISSWDLGTDVGPSLSLCRADSDTVGTYSPAIGSNDVLGNVRFNGSDGTKFIEGAKITASADGTWGTDNGPTKLVFFTTPDGSASPTERLRLDSSGRLGLGTSSPGQLLDVRGNSNPQIKVSETNNSTSAGLFIENQGQRNWQLWADRSTDTFRLGNNSRATTNITVSSAGNVGIGTTSPLQTLDVASSGTCAIRAKTLDTSGFAVGSLIAEYTGGGGGVNTRCDLRAGDQYAYLVTTTNHPILFGTNATERARIDSSGRLLVGTSSARSNFFNSTFTPGFQIEAPATDARMASIVCNAASAAGSYLILGKTRSASVGGTALVSDNDEIGSVDFQAADGSELVRAASIAAVVDGTPGANDMPGRLVFSTTADGASSPTERMRIQSDGKVLIGTTTAVDVTTGTADGFTSVGTVTDFSRNSNPAIRVRRRSSDGDTLQFYRDTTLVGSISVTTTATAYNTSSDYRLKENVAPVTDGITRLQQLKPSRFNFIADPAKTVDGFLAHEVQTIVPEAITGEKDAVDDDGNPVYQGIDQSKLVPLLTAALQEAIGRIETLEAEVAALKAS